VVIETRRGISTSVSMRIWIDIENAPQVQYLSPFVRVVTEAGHDVIVTARDQDVTIELLRGRGIEPYVIGASSGSSTITKLLRLFSRASLLALHFCRQRPDMLIGASRASDLAAWCLRITSFQFTDYEFADDRISRFTRTYLLYPDVIGEGVFLTKGLRRDRLVPFPGLKETISFAGLDIGSVEPHPFPGIDGLGLAKVLFRPPGESTHYFVEESLQLALELLGTLAARENVVVVYAPRYARQISYLDHFCWKNEPQVLQRGVPFVSLLKGVDAVISSGGTMLREAAYLGVPAFSILRSGIGQVDRYLESLGRLVVLEGVDELPALFPSSGERVPLTAAEDVPATLVETMIGLHGGAP
jgi:uncharacterized protein